MSEEQYYSADFWFGDTNAHEQQQAVSGYGKEYYVYKLYENLICQISDIPKDGYIVVLGTNRCVSFNLLCNKFGKERCVGFDIANPISHPCIEIKDCSQLSQNDDIPIAFVHNDMGSFPLTPKLKLHAQKWALRNVIEGGYFLSRNNLNSAKYDIETLMSKNGYLNTHLSTIEGLMDLGSLDFKTIEGHMLSKKITRIFY